MSEEKTPPLKVELTGGLGVGLGECPYPRYRHRQGEQYTAGCGCQAPCRKCGHAKHTAVHRHALNGKPGDPPWDHQYEPPNVK